MKRMALLTTTLTIAVIALVPLATADVPQMINYQGRLTDAGGAPLDTTVSMVFTIYDAATLGNVKWTETHPACTVVSGLFNVTLGAGTPPVPIEDTVFNQPDRYLGIQVGSDPEITPRTELVTVPYAFRVSTVDGASGGTVTGDLEVAGKATIGTNLTNTGDYSFVAGHNCSATYDYVTISGGYNSLATQWYASIGGGWSNEAHSHATVAGGRNNTASADQSSVGGGGANTASGPHSRIGGGANNAASGFASAITGGSANTASGERSTVGAGVYNNASGGYATIGGGNWNSAAGQYSAVLGGDWNVVAGQYSAILGGHADTITDSADHSYLFGIGSKLEEDSTFMVDMPHIRFGDGTTGYEFPTADGSANQVMATDGSGQLGWTTVTGGGPDNDWQVDTAGVNMWSIPPGNVGVGMVMPTAKLHVNGDLLITDKATIGPGHTNTGTYGFVAGSYNTASGLSSTVGGGSENTASGESSTVGGGISNNANGWRSTVCGGGENEATHYYSIVCGGYSNVASGIGGTISGGQQNVASASNSTVGGGVINVASGAYSTIPGGYTNAAGGDYSLAAGRRAKANHDGSFVWADGSDADFSSTSDNQFSIRASSGVRIGVTGQDTICRIGPLAGGAGAVHTYGPNGRYNVALASSGTYPNHGYIAVYDSLNDLQAGMLVCQHSTGAFFANGPNGNLNVSLDHLAANADHGYVSVADAGGVVKAMMYVDAAGQGIVQADVKNFRMANPNQPGTEIWYASLEGPEAAAYVRGTARLIDGHARVSLPEHFEAVASEDGITVQVTPLSAASMGLAVVEKGPGRIDVVELAGGRGNYEFDYTVTAVRKGYEDYQVVRAAQQLLSEPAAPAEPAVSSSEQR